MLVSEALPQTTLNQYEYSAEGETLGQNSTTAYDNGLNLAKWTYTVRGEVKTSPPALNAPSGGYTTSQTMYANGTPIQIPTSNFSCGKSCFTSYAIDRARWDATMGVNLQLEYDGTTATKSTTTVDSEFGYDSAGRLTSESGSSSPVTSGSGSWSITRSFDGENHETDNGHVIWGPNGHPAMLSTGSGNFQTLHWDGDQLLFTTELSGASGVLVDVKAGADADITPVDASFKGLTFYDRGPGGQVVGCHNKQGTTYIGLNSAVAGEFTNGDPVCTTKVTPLLPYTTAKFPTIMWATSPCPEGSCGAVATKVTPGTILGMPRRDGYAWGVGTFQGRRTFDSSAGTWTAPDAYGGNVHDPMSQKSYMWNNNNPVAYSDPSGYISQTTTTVQGNGDTAVRIDVYVTFSGDQDSQANRNTYIQGLLSTWSDVTRTDMNGTTYDVTLVIHDVTGHEGSAPAGQLNHINFTSDQNADIRPSGLNQDHMNVRVGPNGRGLVGYGSSHEFGHMMGMNDFWCRSSSCGSIPFGSAFAWAKGDIMGEQGGQVTGNDFADLLSRHGQGPNFAPPPGYVPNQ